MASTRASAVRKKTAARRPSNTRQRIIDRSIQLFNRYGLRNVAIDHIAAELDISPGNLTYHFPRKQDLISATLGLLQERMRAAVERPEKIRSLHEAAEYMISIYRALWDFRFFFNALTHLLADPQIRRDYMGFRDWALDSIDGELQHFRARGYFNEVQAPNSYRLMADNLWALWLHWLRKQQVESPTAVRPSDAALYDCALHNYSLLQPQMTAQAAAELMQAFEALLPLHGVEPAPRKAPRKLASRVPRRTSANRAG